MEHVDMYPLADAQPRHRAYNLWVAVWWYGLVVYDFLGTGFVNGTIHCAYVKHTFRPNTSLSGSLGAIWVLLSSILVALGSPGDGDFNRTTRLQGLCCTCARFQASGARAARAAHMPRMLHGTCRYVSTG